MAPVDFQATGIFLIRCGTCGGLLAPRRQAAAAAARFAWVRAHRQELEDLGRTLAEAERARTERRLGAAGGGPARIPLPVVLPLADGAPRRQAFPAAAWGTIALLVAVHLLRLFSGAPLELPGGLAGLPSGAGAGGLSAAALFAAPFVHAGLAPLALGALFLFVLGDNVEERLGPFPFLLLFLLCGAAAGTAHVLWGRPGAPAAAGSAGAVAGVLGAYLVFFPNVSIRMYGMGRIASVPAYLFACAWVAGAFLLEGDLLARLLDPAPYSFAGHAAGFGTGALCAAAWRLGREGG